MYVNINNQKSLYHHKIQHQLFPPLFNILDPPVTLDKMSDTHNGWKEAALKQSYFVVFWCLEWKMLSTLCCIYVHNFSFYSFPSDIGTCTR